MITRFLSGIVYIALMVLGIYSSRLTGNPVAGFLIFSALLLFFAVVGIHEVYHNLEIRGHHPDKGVGFLLGIVTFVACTAGNILRLPTEFPLIVLGLWMLLPVRHLFLKREQPVVELALTALPLVWVVVPLLLLEVIGNRSIGLLMTLFICTWANDTGAYLCGKAFGRHKLWERHSPKKTWEGTLGGALLSVVAGVLVLPLLAEGFLWWYGALVGGVCTVCGTLGDLAESMFKRYCGVKDSGRIMPGHGGILDRLDSVLFISPVMAVLVAIAYIL